MEKPIGLPPARRVFERAVRSSSLPALTRHVLITLASHIDEATGVIPDGRSPSFSVLVAETGMSRSTLAAHLTRAEIAGWLHRESPSKADALRRHARTRYTLAVPASVDPIEDTAAADGLRPVQVLNTAGSVDGPRPVREPNATGAAAEPADAPHSVHVADWFGSGGAHRFDGLIDGSDQDLLTTIQHTIREATGRRVSREWAALVRRDVLGSRLDVRAPAAYVAAAIRRDPARFIPTVPEPNGPLPVPRLAPLGERDNPANAAGLALARAALAGAGAR
jgi:hypothetical protein